MGQSQNYTPSERTATKRRLSSTRSRRRKQAAGRAVPFTVKLLLVPLLLFISLLAGAIVGYSIVGDGSAAEVFNLKTWKHMYDLIFAAG